MVTEMFRDKTLERTREERIVKVTAGTAGCPPCRLEEDGEVWPGSKPRVESVGACTSPAPHISLARPGQPLQGRQYVKIYTNIVNTKVTDIIIITRHFHHPQSFHFS